MPAPSALNLRREMPADIAAVREVETAAFGQPNEAALVDALRGAAALILSGVAEIGGKIVGHIAFSPVGIEGGQGNFHALALAPVAVHPDWQRKGIGSALINWSLAECRRDGHSLVIVLGHPDYYPRFGFVQAMPLGIRCPFEVSSEAFMLLELFPGALAGRSGAVRYRPEFASL
jgi:putative acetyltransferase